MAATFHPVLELNAALSSFWLTGCGPVSGPSSLKHNTYRVPPCSVTDAKLATYPGRSSPSKVWNSPLSSTVSNLRPRRSSWNASAAANSTSIPRASAFSLAIASAVSATSTPRTDNPSVATCRAFSPVPQPTSSTAPANPPSDAKRTTAGCGRPISHGAGPAWYDASQGSPVIRSWLVGFRPPNGSSARVPDRSDNFVPFVQLILRHHCGTLNPQVLTIPQRISCVTCSSLVPPHV